MAKTAKVKAKKKEHVGHLFVPQLMARKREIEQRIEQLKRDKAYLDAVMKDLDQMQRLWRSS